MVRTVLFSILLIFSFKFVHSQEVDESKYYNIKAIHSGHFLSVGANSMQNNASVLQWSKKSDASEDGQSFQFVPVGDYYKISIRNKMGKCLTISKNKMGAPVVMSEYTESDFQLWRLSQHNGNYKILSKANGWSFDITDVSKEKGAILSVWESVEGAENQLFSLNVALDEKPYWENLGPLVNSKISETQLCLSPDGKQMYFSRGNSVNGQISNGDIYLAKSNEKGTWEKPLEVKELNNQNHNAVLGFLPGGNEVLLFGDYTGGDALFSTCKRTKKGWENPKPLKVKVPSLTQRVWSGTMGSDGKTLLLEINITGRMNESDIYVSFLNEKGQWSKPISLGKKINIPKAWDGTPFLSPDMTTLYFNSTREGQGSVFYMSKRLDETWTKWSDPVKLETSMYEGANLQYYQSTGNGEYAYFISSVKSFGEGDIQRMKIKKEVKPDPFLIVNGRVLDKETKKPLSASVIFENLESGTELGQLISNPGDGSFQIALPKGKKYGVFASTSSYYPIAENLDLHGLEKYEEITKDLYLAPIEVGQTIVLNNIFFDTGKSTLKPESFPELERVIKLIKANRNIRIEIRGHTDNVGKEIDNQRLSENRAKAVKKYLIDHGCPSNSLITNGYGESQSITTNDTKEGRKQNRRVEFYIIEN